MRLLRNADVEHGGFGGAPKFPTPTSLAILLAAGDALPERKAKEALEHVVLTCREMARGGVFDQLGGGFHRYSVDANWCVPHFEKMLYDQGQLLSIYLEAWRRSGGVDDELLWPIRETVSFLRRELRGRLSMRYVPFMTFALDSSIEEANHLLTVLDSLAPDTTHDTPKSPSSAYDGPLSFPNSR